jgi:hypothetical protein
VNFIIFNARLNICFQNYCKSESWLCCYISVKLTCILFCSVAVLPLVVLVCLDLPLLDPSHISYLFWSCYAFQCWIWTIVLLLLCSLVSSLSTSGCLEPSIISAKDFSLEQYKTKKCSWSTPSQSEDHCTVCCYCSMHSRTYIFLKNCWFRAVCQLMFLAFICECHGRWCLSTDSLSCH